MANRTFTEDALHLIKNPVYLYTAVSVGALGAVTLLKRQFLAMGATSTAPSTSLISAPTSGNGYAYGDGRGIRSVSRTGAGAWTFTLSDPYLYILGVELVQTSNATGLLTSGFGVGVVSGSTSITTNTAQGNGGVIAIVLNNGSGAATDPASGDVLTLRFTLGNASEP